MVNKILEIAPYSLSSKEKEKLLSEVFVNLTSHHFENCEPYRKMLTSINYTHNKKQAIRDIPFIPVRLFKMLDLVSVTEENIIKTMTSSGTTGQEVSKIFLDRTTASTQIIALNKIVASFLGAKRTPMIIIDNENVIKDRKLFSARGAGILGFSMFGSERLFALDEEMNLKIDEILEFLKKHSDQRVFIFGFTYVIYKHLFQELKRLNIKLDLSNSLLIHGGGWKKLISESVSSSLFKENLKKVCGISSVHDYYGMVEQTGSIHMECEYGYLHAPVYADIIIRRPLDFSEAEFGERGIIQVLSILPNSYPGHSILTEDEGVLIGEDNCKCGRLGKYFNVLGRLQNAEIRGCSDTLTE